MSDAGEDWTELETFVRMLIDTGNASLESKIPDREPLQWAVDKLGRFCAAIEAVEQSNLLSPAHKQAARRSLVLGALAAAFEIGQHGTISANTKAAAAQAHMTVVRAGKDRLRQQESRVLAEVVDRHRCPGDEARPWKTDDAIRGAVNAELEAAGLDPVRRGQIAKLLLRLKERA